MIIHLWTSRRPSYLPGGVWPRCRSARAFLGPQLVARAIKKVARRSRVRAGHAAHALSCTTMSGACGRAARDGRGTRGQSSGQGQIQGYRTDAKKSLTKYLDILRTPAAAGVGGKLGVRIPGVDRRASALLGYSQGTAQIPFLPLSRG